MQRISLPWVLGVANAINDLDYIVPDVKLAEVQFRIYNAKNQLEMLFEQSVYSTYLRTSRERANTLREALRNIIERKSDDPDAVLGKYDAWNIKFVRDDFRTVFYSELSTLPSFLVTRKKGYDTDYLIEKGTCLFPESLSAKVPEAVPDALEIGRALAFELPTACGFHVFRLTKAVLKRYWDEVSGGEEHPDLKTIGKYAHVMKEKGYGEEKVREALKQMAKLHRNPLIHPEVILTEEEAIGTIAIAHSVVGAMLQVLPDVPPTTGFQGAFAGL